jgi:hypothetical protein
MAGADESTTGTQPFWPYGESGCTVTSSQSQNPNDLTLSFTFPIFDGYPRSWRFYDFKYSPGEDW